MNDVQTTRRSTTAPTVSVVIIFLNAEDFIQQAIDSVFAQSFDDWELLLVDDGSSDGSTRIALDIARNHSNRVRYLEHANHVNKGMSATRNLGIRNSRGRFVAMLDADDVWLPDKLAEQVAILDANDEAAMVFGRDTYWYSWNPDSDETADHAPELGIEARKLFGPQELLPLFLNGKAAIPCPTGILLRSEAIERTGGFVETFLGANMVYEDQAFYAKLLSRESVIAENACWTLYRQHPNSSCSVGESGGTAVSARRYYLTWLEQYLRENRISDRGVWNALRQAQWKLDHPRIARVSRSLSRLAAVLR